ncbi:MAG: tRNA-dependent cyclodipeptide synthase [Methylovulum sp.]|nr:tRNA-dependent cyclodipeptide synthase [Methylovulum sp.]
MNCTQVHQLREFLDSKQAHYIYLAYSNAYCAEKIQDCEFGLERTLIESVLVNIVHDDHHTEVVMMVVPATRRIELDSLRKLWGTNRIEFVGKQQAQQLFPDDDMGALLPFQHFHADMRLFYADEILQLQELNFCIRNPSNRIKMPLNDFLIAAGPTEAIGVATIAKYKIEVAQVFPQNQRSALQQSGHCMLGYSLQSQSFTPAKLAGMAEWISRHFSECSVLIGDGIHRITLEINGTPPQYAENRALRMGREIIDGDAIIFNRHQRECQFHVISTAELQKTASYHAYHQALSRLFAEDDKFHASVRLFAQGFVGNSSMRCPTSGIPAVIGHRFQQDPERLEYCRQLSCLYLLEEVAITAMLIQQGVFVFVYPGTLTIMQELSLGEHPGAPEEFKQLVSVNLRQKRR